MNKPLALLTLLSFAAPLQAHPGMDLDGPLHRLLHTVGTDNVIALGALAAAAAAAVLARRVLGSRRRAAPDTRAR